MIFYKILSSLLKKESTPWSLLNILFNDGLTSNQTHFEVHDEAAREMPIVFTGSGSMCRKMDLLFETFFD
jgi:hypothetical protein